MVCCGRVALPLLLTLLTLLAQVAQSKPRRHQHRHFHGECLLEQVRDEVKHTWQLCEGQPESHRVLHGIPLTSLCDDDFNALSDFTEDTQDKMNKCCRSPDHAKCSDNEWRTVLLARYIHVLCDHMHC